MDELEWRNVRGVDHLIKPDGEIVASLRLTADNTYQLIYGFEAPRKFIERDSARRFALRYYDELLKAPKVEVKKAAEKPPKEPPKEKGKGKDGKNS